MKEPKRLTADERVAELSPDLVDALRALREEMPDAAVVARTQRALEALPPNPPAPSKLAFNILAGGGAVVISAVLVALLARDTDEHQPVPERTVVSPLTAAAAPEPSPALAAPVAPEAPPAVLAAQPAPAEHAAPARSTRRATARKQAAPAAETEPTPSAAGAAPSPARSDVAPEPATQARHDELARPEATTPVPAAARVPEVVSTPTAPEPTDEAGLLFRAKRLASRDPAGALRLLDSHAFYFPNGAFVQEREILAIGLLERLGQLDRARERGARFRARFPNSVYRSTQVP